MRIDCQHPARLTGERLGTSVVIDVLRATSTATVLMARGASRMFAVDSPADLPGVTGGREAEFLVVSELEEIEHGPNRIDNSPVTAKRIDLAGRTPILVTTNGTRALAAAAPLSDRCLLASFLNLRSVVEQIERSSPELVTLLPAGKFRDATGAIEDDLCAEMLRAVLLGEDPKEQEMFERIRTAEKIQRRLLRPGFGDDLTLSLTPNLYDVVPIVDRVAHPTAIEIRRAVD